MYDGSFNILNSNQEYFYVLNKSKDFIGIKTELITNPGISTFIGSGPINGDLKSHGGVLAPNGKIYAVPYRASTVLEIDPVGSGSTNTFGSVGSGVDKWLGGVLAPNGKIYAIPHNSSNVLVIDPVGLTTSSFGSLGSSPAKWAVGF